LGVTTVVDLVIDEPPVLVLLLEEVCVASPFGRVFLIVLLEDWVDELELECVFAL
jgi:hypothetical protein